MRFDQEQFSLVELSTKLKGQYDVFVCSASYEERCKSIPTALAGFGAIGRRLVCFNHKSSAAVSANADFLVEQGGKDAEEAAN